VAMSRLSSVSAHCRNIRFAPMVLKTPCCSRRKSLIHPSLWWKLELMMGQWQVDQAALIYEFSLERHVPANHLLRLIDRFVDLSEVRRYLVPFYSCTGLPSIDSECS
jgi:hypothetical protein